MTQRPNAVAYTDPNCPFCFAMEERIAAGGFADRVEWRGVQHAPHLPVPMAPADPELAGEARSLAALAPDVPVAGPGGKPNTAAAIEHAAAALRTDPARGRAFVRSLYAAFWRDGRDLSDPRVLAVLADDAGLPGLAVGADDRQAARRWQYAWSALGLGGVPCVVRDDGRMLYGLADPETIAAFFAG